MNAWKVIIPTLVIFIAGVITGGLLVNFTKERTGTVKTNTVVVNNNPWLLRNEQLLKRMDRELDLTPEQHAEIVDIMKQSQERVRAIYHPIAPLMNTEMRQVRAEIAKKLTPEQRRKFEGFNKGRPGFGGRRMATNSLGNAPGTNAISTNSAQ